MENLKVLKSVVYVQGKIFFDKKDITNIPTEKRQIGMVFQNYALWPHMTVLKNIQYGLKIQRMSSQDLHTRSQAVITMCHLEDVLDRYPSQISGGQQQRVALARALAVKPQVLLLDEPLSNLDSKLRIEMRENIRIIHQKTKLTIVYVTHDQKEALAIGSHITVINEGEIIENNTPRKLYEKPKSSFTAQFIGETNLIKAEYIGEDNHKIKAKTHRIPSWRPTRKKCDSKRRWKPSWID